MSLLDKKYDNLLILSALREALIGYRTESVLKYVFLNIESFDKSTQNLIFREFRDPYLYDSEPAEVEFTEQGIQKVLQEVFKGKNIKSILKKIFDKIDSGDSDTKNWAYAVLQDKLQFLNLEAMEKSIILAAVSYSVGRRTYIVGHTCEFLRKNWKKFPDTLQKEIKDIIQDNYAKEAWGDPRIDKPEWDGVLALSI